MNTLRIDPTAPDADGLVLTTGSTLAHCAMKVFRLAPGAIIRHRDAARECCLVLLSGRGNIAADGLAARSIGGRESPFEDEGYAAYVPAGCELHFHATSHCEVALCLAAGGSAPPRIIPPEAWRVSTRGTGQATRLIRDILPETEPALSLLVVEVVTPGGHWSSFPPHKHDTDNWPHETALDEVYYHRFARPGGFGFQRIYTDDRALDEGIVLQDGSAVLVPRGYHPVCAAPGCDLYYLNVMAGPRRSWRVQVDPFHMES